MFARFDGSAFEVSVQGWTTQWGARYDATTGASRIFPYHELYPKFARVVF